MSMDDFQSKYASVLETMLKSAVAETTKLFETMVDELKEEISQIKKENEDLKIRCSRFENEKSQPGAVHTGENDLSAGPSDSFEKRDSAVQCDLPPMRTVRVEQCEPLPLQNQGQQYAFQDTECSLQESNCVPHGEGNSQMEFILVKQESALKQEEVEAAIDHGQVLSECASSTKTSVSGSESEWPLQECSTEQSTLPQKDEETKVVMEPPCSIMGISVQEAQNQSSEPENSLVISLAAVHNNIGEESEVDQKILQTETEADLTTHVKQQQADSQPHLSVRRRRRQPPKKRKQKEIDQEDQEELNSPSVRIEGVAVSSAVDTVNISSTKSPSIQESAEIALEDVVHEKVGSSPDSVISLSSTCTSENQNPCIEVEEAMQAPPGEVLFETLNTAMVEFPQATSDQLKERRTSVTLQDAVLLVEAMNQSTSGRLMPIHTQCASHVSALQMAEEVPAESQTTSNSLFSASISRDQQSGTPPHPKVASVIQGDVSPVASEKQQLQSIVLTAAQESAEPPSPGPSAQLSFTSQDSSISASDDTISPQKKDNTTDKPESPTVTASETCSSSNMSVEVVPTSVLPVLPQQKLYAVVRLVRLPFPVSTEESVLVSNLFPKSTILSSETPFLSHTSKTSEELNDNHERAPLSFEACSLMEEALDSGYEQPSTPSALTTSNSRIELTSVRSHDTSDSHLQRNKAHFLAQLAVVPTVQGPKKASLNDFEKATASHTRKIPRDNKKSQKKLLFIRLRSHLKNCSQAGLSKTNKETCTETKTTTVSPVKTKLDNRTVSTPCSITPRRSGLCKDGVRSKRSVSEPASVSSRRSKRSNSSTSVSPKRLNLARDGTSSKNTKSTPVSPKKSSSTKEKTSPRKIKSTSVTLKRSTSSRDGVDSKSKKSRSESPCRSNSTKESAASKRTKNAKPSSVIPEMLTTDSASPKKTENTPIHARTASSSKNGTSPQESRSPRRLTRDSAGLKTTENTSVHTRTGSLIKNGTNAKESPSSRNSSFNKDGPKQIKREYWSFSPIWDNAISTKQTKSKNGSPMPECPKRAKNDTSPKRTGESTPADDDTGPKKSFKAINAVKLAAAGRPKRVAKTKNSNKLKLQASQLAKKQANCAAVKRIKVTGVWYPPVMPPSPPKEEKSSPAKTEEQSCNETSVEPPSFAFKTQGPIVSPLQPLSVIGTHLLKNQCGECGRMFTSSAALESHVSLHTERRPFSCSFCGKCFATAKSLKWHGRAHANGKIHICPQCGKGFVYSFALTQHIQMVHGRIKPFICQICDKGFFRKRDVEIHIQSHTGERPFDCNLCDRKFKRRVLLNVHLRWHNGEKRHWCTYCGKGFLDWNNLKRHLYVHTGERPYSCPHCPKHFTQTGHLKKHVKNVHKIK